MKLIYPMTYVKITQGSYGSYSHSNKKAIDLAGKDWNKDSIFAPCDGMKIVLINDNYVLAEVYGDIELTSGKTVKYVEILFYHETANAGIKVGQVLSKGQVFMKEGTKGRATGNHVHIRVRDSERNEILPEEVFWFNKSIHTLVANESKYPIVTMEDEYMLSKDDANKLILLLKANYSLAKSKDSRDEIHRLANELRKASSQPET